MDRLSGAGGGRQGGRPESAASGMSSESPSKKRRKRGGAPRVSGVPTEEEGEEEDMVVVPGTPAATPTAAAAAGGMGSNGAGFAAKVDITKQKTPSKTETDAAVDFLMSARSGDLEKLVDLLDQVDIDVSNVNGLNALHLSSKEGHYNIVNELLRRGANVNAATKKGNTALHIAALAGHESIARSLVQHGALINVQSQSGFTPLYMAAQENHVDIVRFLMSNGANQTIATQEGFTPMAVAVQLDNKKVIAALSDYESLGRRRSHLPALHAAAKRDDVVTASLLLQGDNDIDAPTRSGFTPLHIACHYGNLNAARFLIDSNADVNYHKTENMITALHIASKWGHKEMVELLLNNRADIQCKTRDGLMPLHCAARSGHDLVVDLLLNRGALVVAKTKNGLSALHMAVQGDHTSCVQLLIKHNALIEDVTMDYLTPLHVAAHCGNVRSAKILLDNRCDVNSRALNGFTPLHVACKKKRIAVVELLLRYGASLEAKTESELTPLHVASFVGDANVVRLLISEGASLASVTTNGETALHLAARTGQTEVIRILLQHNAVIDAKSNDEMTSLHIASRLGDVDTVVLLLQNGAQTDALTADRYTPLHISAKEGHSVVAQVLVEHGANQKLQTKKGFTPLHLCAKYDRPEVARVLLSHKNCAEVDALARNALTPLHVAAHYGHDDVIQLLLRHDADPRRTAQNGYTALHIAARRNLLTVAKILLDNKKVDPSAESKNGYTALHLASQEGHREMVRLLLSHGTHVDCAATNGLRPLHLAAQDDHLQVVEVLVGESHGEIDPQTKAGYTPLHTACHFGRPAIVKYLLGRGASVDARTNEGYTPLHQAAQQGHVLIINALLNAKASPDKLTNAGETPLSIAEHIGYVSCAEILRPITTVKPSSSAPGGGQVISKFHVVLPETMHDSVIYDSDEDNSAIGGSSPLITDRLNDEVFSQSKHSSIPRKSRRRDLFSFDRAPSERFGTGSTATGMQAIEEELCYMTNEKDLHISYATLNQEDEEKGQLQSTTASITTTSTVPMRGRHSSLGPPTTSRPPRGCSSLDRASRAASRASELESSLHTSHTSDHDSRLFESSSYSGMLSDGSLSNDNMALDRNPVHSGFLVSFMVDARGGAKRGWRHSGVRIIVPPNRACQPTRVTCKLVKREKLPAPPPLMEGEALASRVLKMGPPGAKFDGPVIIEIPHYASMRGQERNITIMRSDDGLTWRDHSVVSTESAFMSALGGSFEGEALETAEELYRQRVTRIITTDFPAYFAIVSTVRAESSIIGSEGSTLNSTVIPSVEAIVPAGALRKKIRLSLQAQPVPDDLSRRVLGVTQTAGPIITLEPRRRKFHRPITINMPLPALTIAKREAMKGVRYENEAPSTLRLLCSLTEGSAPAVWEDITDSTPLRIHQNCASFSTTVSARFWLIDSSEVNLTPTLAGELYKEVNVVPYMSKFIVFAKRRAPRKGQLRVFCTTDDKLERTLENQEHFVEVARSREIEVLDGKTQYLEMTGNLKPISKSTSSRVQQPASPVDTKQLQLVFNAFATNRVAYPVRVEDLSQDPTGRIFFSHDPQSKTSSAGPAGRGAAKGSTAAGVGGAAGAGGTAPICSLSVTLPDYVFERSTSQLDLNAPNEFTHEDMQSCEDLRIPLMSDMLQSDWVKLAHDLGIRETDVLAAQVAQDDDRDQAELILRRLVHTKGRADARSRLETSLRRIGRIDIIKRCLYSTITTEEIIETRRPPHVAGNINGDAKDEWRARNEEFRGDDDMVIIGDEKMKPTNFDSEASLTFKKREIPGEQRQSKREQTSRARDPDSDLMVRVNNAATENGFVMVDLAENEGRANILSKSVTRPGFQDAKIIPESRLEMKITTPVCSEKQTEVKEILKKSAVAVPTEKRKKFDEFPIEIAPSEPTEKLKEVEEVPITIAGSVPIENRMEMEEFPVEIESSVPFQKRKEVEEYPIKIEPSQPTEEQMEVEELPLDVANIPESRTKREISSPPVTEVVIEDGAVDLVSDEKEENEVKVNGTNVKRVIRTTRHLLLFKEITKVDGIVVESRDAQRLVGTEIDEDVMEMPAGVSADSANVCIKTAEHRSDDILPDGSWLRRRVWLQTLERVSAPSQAEIQEPMIDIQNLDNGQSDLRTIAVETVPVSAAKRDEIGLKLKPTNENDNLDHKSKDKPTNEETSKDDKSVELVHGTDSKGPVEIDTAQQVDAVHFDDLSSEYVTTVKSEFHHLPDHLKQTADSGVTQIETTDPQEHKGVDMLELGTESQSVAVQPTSLDLASVADANIPQEELDRQKSNRKSLTPSDEFVMLDVPAEMDQATADEIQNEVTLSPEELELMTGVLVKTDQIEMLVPDSIPQTTANEFGEDAIDNSMQEIKAESLQEVVPDSTTLITSKGTDEIKSLLKDAAADESTDSVLESELTPEEVDSFVVVDDSDMNDLQSSDPSMQHWLSVQDQIVAEQNNFEPEAGQRRQDEEKNLDRMADHAKHELVPEYEEGIEEEAPREILPQAEKEFLLQDIAVAEEKAQQQFLPEDSTTVLQQTEQQFLPEDLMAVLQEPPEQQFSPVDSRAVLQQQTEQQFLPEDSTAVLQEPTEQQFSPEDSRAVLQQQTAQQFFPEDSMAVLQQHTEQQFFSEDLTTVLQEPNEQLFLPEDSRAVLQQQTEQQFLPEDLTAVLQEPTEQQFLPQDSRAVLQQQTEQQFLPEDLMAVLQEPTEEQFLPEDSRAVLQQQTEQQFLPKDLTAILQQRTEQQFLPEDLTAVLQEPTEQQFLPEDSRAVLQQQTEQQFLPEDLTAVLQEPTEQQFLPEDSRAVLQQQTEQQFLSEDSTAILQQQTEQLLMPKDTVSITEEATMKEFVLQEIVFEEEQAQKELMQEQSHAALLPQHEADIIEKQDQRELQDGEVLHSEEQTKERLSPEDVEQVQEEFVLDDKTILDEQPKSEFIPADTKHILQAPTRQEFPPDGNEAGEQTQQETLLSGESVTVVEAETEKVLLPQDATLLESQAQLAFQLREAAAIAREETPQKIQSEDIPYVPEEEDQIQQEFLPQEILEEQIPNAVVVEQKSEKDFVQKDTIVIIEAQAPGLLTKDESSVLDEQAEIEYLPQDLINAAEDSSNIQEELLPQEAMTVVEEEERLLHRDEATVEEKTMHDRLLPQDMSIVAEKTREALPENVTAVVDVNIPIDFLTPDVTVEQGEAEKELLPQDMHIVGEQIDVTLPENSGTIVDEKIPEEFLTPGLATTELDAEKEFVPHDMEIVELQPVESFPESTATEDREAGKEFLPQDMEILQEQMQVYLPEVAVTVLDGKLVEDFLTLDVPSATVEEPAREFLPLSLSMVEQITHEYLPEEATPGAEGQIEQTLLFQSVEAITEELPQKDLFSPEELERKEVDDIIMPEHKVSDKEDKLTDDISTDTEQQVMPEDLQSIVNEEIKPEFIKHDINSVTVAQTHTEFQPDEFSGVSEQPAEFLPQDSFVVIEEQSVNESLPEDMAGVIYEQIQKEIWSPQDTDDVEKESQPEFMLEETTIWPTAEEHAQTKLLPDDMTVVEEENAEKVLLLPIAVVEEEMPHELSQIEQQMNQFSVPEAVAGKKEYIVMEFQPEFGEVVEVPAESRLDEIFIREQQTHQAVLPDKTVAAEEELHPGNETVYVADEESENKFQPQDIIIQEQQTHKVILPDETVSVEEAEAGNEFLQEDTSIVIVDQREQEEIQEEYLPSKRDTNEEMKSLDAVDDIAARFTKAIIDESMQIIAQDDVISQDITEMPLQEVLLVTDKTVLLKLDEAIAEHEKPCDAVLEVEQSEPMLKPEKPLERLHPTVDETFVFKSDDEEQQFLQPQPETPLEELLPATDETLVFKSVEAAIEHGEPVVAIIEADRGEQFLQPEMPLEELLPTTDETFVLKSDEAAIEHEEPLNAVLSVDQEEQFLQIATPLKEMLPVADETAAYKPDEVCIAHKPSEPEVLIDETEFSPADIASPVSPVSADSVSEKPESGKKRRKKLVHIGEMVLPEVSHAIPESPIETQTEMLLSEFVMDDIADIPEEPTVVQFAQPGQSVTLEMSPAMERKSLPDAILCQDAAELYTHVENIHEEPIPVEFSPQELSLTIETTPTMTDTTSPTPILCPSIEVEYLARVVEDAVTDIPVDPTVVEFVQPDQTLTLRMSQTLEEPVTTIGIAYPGAEEAVQAGSTAESLEESPLMPDETPREGTLLPGERDQVSAVRPIELEPCLSSEQAEPVLQESAAIPTDFTPDSSPNFDYTTTGDETISRELDDVEDKEHFEQTPREVTADHDYEAYVEELATEMAKSVISDSVETFAEPSVTEMMTSTQESAASPVEARAETDVPTSATNLDISQTTAFDIAAAEAESEPATAATEPAAADSELALTVAVEAEFRQANEAVDVTVVQLTPDEITDDDERMNGMANEVLRGLTAIHPSDIEVKVGNGLLHDDNDNVTTTLQIDSEGKINDKDNDDNKDDNDYDNDKVSDNDSDDDCDNHNEIDDDDDYDNDDGYDKDDCDNTQRRR